MRNNSISVIIPNYNGRHLLQQNLPSVLSAIENTGVDFEIIVVDDCSLDDSVNFLKLNYPAIKLIISEKNQGFSASCNKGIAISQKELILLLNTDIELNSDFFSTQFKYFELPDTFGVSSKIIGAKKGEIQDTARFFTFSGFKIKANYFFHLADENFLCPTAYLSGANALIDARKLKMMGGFDEIFSPFYYEDFDLGLRAWRTGWKCYYDPKSYCIHDHSSTTKNYRTRNWVKAIFFRNRFIVHAIHLSSIKFTGWIMQIVFIDLLFMWLGMKFYLYKSFIMFLSSRTKILESQQNLAILMKQNNSQKSINDVIRLMTEMVKGQDIIKGRN
ncbi:glycosyltransferase family 2 protein [Daejeonella oryzae]|uniref:glycosyltransferase family 2 protein n=1 Tax=Daejeonella oryzae TaxID=1122943 RepID=UPI000413082B|nr:glycosyltransferase family 2 protein [Daejeonella oryzae]